MIVTKTIWYRDLYAFITIYWGLYEFFRLDKFHNLQDKTNIVPGIALIVLLICPRIPNFYIQIELTVLNVGPNIK